MKSRLLYTESNPLGPLVDEAPSPAGDLPIAESQPPAFEPPRIPSEGSPPSNLAVPPQPSHRPRGRNAIAIIFIAVLGFGAYSAWDGFFRYSAQGVVVGRVAKISPPWPATIQAVYARPGDAVKQGDVLALIQDPEQEAAIQRLIDELRVAQAQLDAEVARITLAARTQRDDDLEISAQYYELQGQLLIERATVRELRARMERIEQLLAVGGATAAEIDTLRFRKQGHTARVAQLEQAATALRDRLEATPTSSLNEAQLKPRLAGIEQLQAEISRIRAKQLEGVIRAPFSGTVLSVTGHVGERSSHEQPLVELLEERSLEIVAYIRQTQTSEFLPGRQVDVVVDDEGRQLNCEIVSIGHRFERPPSVSDGGQAAEPMLPVYLRPPVHLPPGVTLRVGSTIRIPATWRLGESS